VIPMSTFSISEARHRDCVARIARDCLSLNVSRSTVESAGVHCRPATLQGACS
jgi:hypothetical protein